MHDVVELDAFYWHLRKTGYDKETTPDLALRLAVLNRALLDATGRSYPKDGNETHEELRADAIAWIEGKTPDGLTCFEICEAIGVNYEYVKRKVRDLVRENGRGGFKFTKATNSYERLLDSLIG
jgi:hypothetical protein